MCYFFLKCLVQTGEAIWACLALSLRKVLITESRLKIGCSALSTGEMQAGGPIVQGWLFLAIQHVWAHETLYLKVKEEGLPDGLVGKGPADTSESLSLVSEAYVSEGKNRLQPKLSLTSTRILWYNPPHLCTYKYKTLNKNFKKSKNKAEEERNVLVFLRLGLAYTTQVIQGQGTLPASTSWGRDYMHTSLCTEQKG